MLPSSISLLQRIDTTIEQLLNRFHNMFEVAVIDGKLRELLAVESLTIETDALTIIRLCEELLLISRGLKETWCLNSIKVDPETKPDVQDFDLIHLKFNELTDKIAQFEKHR